MIVELVRHAYLDQCTLGYLDVDTLKLATIERPWISIPDGPGGKRRESCVPDGQYALRPHTSGKFPDTYALVNSDLGVWYQNVPAGQSWGRSAILIHKGNRTGDVVGCIAVGMRHAFSQAEHAVLESGRALDLLRTVLGQDTHTMIIRPTRGTAE